MTDEKDQKLRNALLSARGLGGDLDAMLAAAHEYAAQAWEEGHAACCDERCFSDGNPYRTIPPGGESDG